MAVIGALGKITFSVSKRSIKTFDNMSWESGTNYAQHGIHLKTPKLEKTGEQADTLSFDMVFSAFLGINPTKEIGRLEKARKKGEVMRLVIGNKIYGKRWVITKISKGLERFDNKGRLLKASVSISLLAYR